jgi:hypothetical protein
MMTHDKIKNAARRRMTETGESYAAARRAVIKAFRAAGTGVSPPDTRSFAISYSDMGRISRWDAARHGDGPGHGGVEIYADVLKVRMAGFHLDMPRTSVRSVKLSTQQTRGTIGVHSRRGTWIVNGSHHGLVEVTIDPPCYTPRQPDTLFLRMRVTSLIVSLVDPDGFIAAIRDDSDA